MISGLAAPGEYGPHFVASRGKCSKQNPPEDANSQQPSLLHLDPRVGYSLRQFWQDHVSMSSGNDPEAPQNGQVDPPTLSSSCSMGVFSLMCRLLLDHCDVQGSG
jgi:hypothetical protein